MKSAESQVSTSLKMHIHPFIYFSFFKPWVPIAKSDTFKVEGLPENRGKGVKGFGNTALIKRVEATE